MRYVPGMLHSRELDTCGKLNQRKGPVDESKSRGGSLIVAEQREIAWPIRRLRFYVTVCERIAYRIRGGVITSRCEVDDANPDARDGTIRTESLGKCK